MAGDIVRTEGLSKQFRGKLAVRNVSLRVDRGSVYAFLGPNGAGKSTTIRLLLGLLRPTAGKVELFGQSIGSHRGEILARYLEAYEQYAPSMQPLVAFATFSRDGVKVFETQPVAVTDGVVRTSRAIPIRLSIPLQGLPPGRYDWQVSVVEPTGRKAAFWQTTIAIVP